jgi:hypothetical protein
METNQRSRSRGKREKLISYPAKQYAKAPNMLLNKKRIANNNEPYLKKMSFKSFDLRRGLTKLENRDGSLEEPSNYLYSNPLRSSSVCHKKSFSQERTSSPRKNKSLKGGGKYTNLIYSETFINKAKEIKAKITSECYKACFCYTSNDQFDQKF